MKVTVSKELANLGELAAWHHLIKFNITAREERNKSEWVPEIKRLTPLAIVELNCLKHKYGDKALNELLTAAKFNVKRVPEIRGAVMRLEIAITENKHKPISPRMEVEGTFDMRLVALIRYKLGKPVERSFESGLYIFYKQWENYYKYGRKPMYIKGIDESAIPKLIEAAEKVMGS